MNCPQCESALLVEVFGVSNPIRCASCGNVAMPLNENSADANRYAWRSFWLGLSSILLLFLTGIPAIYYGVRSLLQMRFIRSQKNDRKAAVAGVTLGVIFGIFASGFVMVLGGMAVLILILFEQSNDPERIEEIVSSIGSIDLPDDFQPIEATGMQGQFMAINWKDGVKIEEAEGRIALISAHQNNPSGNIQMTIKRDDFELHRDIKVDSSRKQVETLKWKFLGEDCAVEKTVEPVVNGEFNTIRYCAKTTNEDIKLGHVLVMSVRDPGKYRDEEVQKIFESFRLKE